MQFRKIIIGFLLIVCRCYCFSQENGIRTAMWQGNEIEFFDRQICIEIYSLSDSQSVKGLVTDVTQN